MQFVLTDADGLADNEEPAILVLAISRSDIVSGNIASVMERLHVLTDSADNIRRYRECLVFQVEGYDDDPRELPEIPEVRAFFRQLVAEWPHWLWFLQRGMGAIGLLMSLLCEVTVIRNMGGGFGTQLENMEEVRWYLNDLSTRGSALFAAYSITAEDAETSISSALIDLFGS